MKQFRASWYINSVVNLHNKLDSIVIKQLLINHVSSIEYLISN